MLARETPAELIVFDLLACSGVSLVDRAFAERWRELDAFTTVEQCQRRLYPSDRL